MTDVPQRGHQFMSLSTFYKSNLHARIEKPISRSIPLDFWRFSFMISLEIYPYRSLIEVDKLFLVLRRRDMNGRPGVVLLCPTSETVTLSASRFCTRPLLSQPYAIMPEVFTTNCYGVSLMARILTTVLALSLCSRRIRRRDSSRKVSESAHSDSGLTVNVSVAACSWIAQHLGSGPTDRSPRIEAHGFEDINLAHVKRIRYRTSG